MARAETGGALQPSPWRLYAVRTPEGLALPFRVATAGERLVAFGLDMLVVAGLTAALAVLAATAVFARSFGTVAAAVALLAGFFLRHGYFIYWEAQRGGMTPGKRAVGLRVISRDGGPLAVEAVFARNLMREIEVFLPLVALLAPQALVPDAPSWGRLPSILWLVVFAAMPLLNAERLRVGDLVAGTLVVRVPKPVLLSDLAEPPRRPRPGAAAENAAAAPAATAGGAAGAANGIAFSREQLDIYGIHELQTLEEVLRRANEGSVEPRVLEEVAARIQKKIGWPRERRGAPPLPFLHAFYAAQRGRLEQKLLFGQRQERKAQPPEGP